MVPSHSCRPQSGVLAGSQPDWPLILGGCPPKSQKTARVYRDWGSTVGQGHKKLDLPTKLVIAAVGTAAVLTALPGSAQQSDASAGSTYTAQVVGTGSPDAIDGQYIVVLKAPATGEDNAALDAAVDRAQDLGADVTHEYGDAINGYAAEMSSTELAKARQDPAVAYIAADQTVSIDGTRSVSSWGQDRIDQRSGLNGKLTTTGDGTGVTAYVIDTGILSTHDDLDGRVTSSYTAISDGNGTEDCNGHGTHVAGTIGGTQYGIAPKVNLVAVRVLDCNGSGSSSGVIAGINWVTANHVSPAVVNMSLGGAANAPLDNAVAASIASGVTYAIAAGNDTADACSYSPARVPGAITVAASTNSDADASFSNYGTCVDLYAPGAGITSDWDTSDSATNTISGTSMATPHVAGAAALYLQANPSAAPADVASALVGNATSGALTGVPSSTPNLLLYVGSATSSTPTPTATPTTATPTTAPTTTTPTTAPTSATPTAVPTSVPSSTTPTATPTPTKPTPTPTKTPTPTCAGMTAGSFTSSAKGKMTLKARAVTATSYTTHRTGLNLGCLTGPKGTDFDLALQKWNGKRWAQVAGGSRSGSTESVSYTGTAGKYRWQVERERGRGSYTLKISHPA